MPRRSASTGAGSSDASTIRAVLRPACGLIPLFESPREDSRVDRLVGGAAREEKPVLGFDVGQGGSSTRAWQLREQVGQDWRQQEFVIAEHKVGVAGSLAQRVARDGKYASQVEPVEQRHEGRRHVGGTTTQPRSVGTRSPTKTRRATRPRRRCTRSHRQRRLRLQESSKASVAPSGRRVRALIGLFVSSRKGCHEESLNRPRYCRDDPDVSAHRVSQWVEARPSRCLRLSSTSRPDAMRVQETTSSPPRLGQQGHRWASAQHLPDHRTQLLMKTLVVATPALIAIAVAPAANADSSSKPLRRGCRWRSEFV
jgi:hypothetical protein